MIGWFGRLLYAFYYFPSKILNAFLATLSITFPTCFAYSPTPAAFAITFTSGLLAIASTVSIFFLASSFTIYPETTFSAWSFNSFLSLSSRLSTAYDTFPATAPIAPPMSLTTSFNGFLSEIPVSF